MRTLQRLAAWLHSNTPGLFAFISLAAISIGLWWERPSLALIVPGTIVFTALSRTYLRGGFDS